MKRKIGLALVVAAALPLAAASVAWACGILATLKLDTKVAAPGQAVTATGRNYGTSNVSDVTIRLRSRDGQVLATSTPLAGGVLNATFPLPANLSPGWYVLVATQTNNSNGTPKAGTPGRTTLRVQGTAASGATPAASPWSSSTPSGPAAESALSGGGGSPLPMVLAIALSLSMLAGGWTLITRHSRSGSRALGI
jgi:hypothetical protein